MRRAHLEASSFGTRCHQPSREKNGQYAIIHLYACVGVCMQVWDECMYEYASCVKACVRIRDDMKECVRACVRRA